MDNSIKTAAGEIIFYDKTVKDFHSLEQLLNIISEEYAHNRTAESVNITGHDNTGKIYKLFFDFNNFAVMLEEAGITFGDKIPLKQKALGEILLDAGVITAKQLDTALKEQAKSGNTRKIGEILIEIDCCNAQQILYALAKQLGIFLQSNQNK